MNSAEIIRKENEEAEKKSKDIWDLWESDSKHVKLTHRNVILAEALILNDSAYSKAFNPGACPEGKYKGSSAYWMSQLKDVLIDNGKVTPYRYEEIINNAVEAVDRENSTHLNADGGMPEIKRRICDFTPDKLFECLQNPDKSDNNLISEISRKTFPEKKGARKNISFASKFCHYACFYVFEGSEEQDNYPIYDNVLRSVLPWYLEQYHIHIPRSKFDQEDRCKAYKVYRNAIDQLLKCVEEESSEKISRNGLDQLLWYFHKNS